MDSYEVMAEKIMESVGRAKSYLNAVKDVHCMADNLRILDRVSGEIAEIRKLYYDIQNLDDED